MPDHSGGDDTLHGLFKGFADVLAESGMPSGLGSPERLARRAQTNRLLRRRCQDFLGRHASDYSPPRQYRVRSQSRGAAIAAA